MKRYVLGFCFSPDKQQVVLIKKQRPAWQKGLYNGVGGSIEETDLTDHDAMEREFFEETGVRIPAKKWVGFAEMFSEDRWSDNPDRWSVHCFYTVSEDYDKVKTTTDEEVEAVGHEFWLMANPDLFIENLKWLIPLALDTKNQKWTKIEYFETEQ